MAEMISVDKSISLKARTLMKFQADTHLSCSRSNFVNFMVAIICVTVVLIDKERASEGIVTKSFTKMGLA